MSGSVPMSQGEMALVVLGLMVISALTRSAFFLTREPWSWPAWVTRGLKYAPLAALAAVVAPEVLMSHGHVVQTWRDARLVSAPVAMAWALWRKDMLTTIGVGMAVYGLFKLGLGWA